MGVEFDGREYPGAVRTRSNLCCCGEPTTRATIRERYHPEINYMVRRGVRLSPALVCVRGCLERRRKTSAAPRTHAWERSWVGERDRQAHAGDETQSTSDVTQGKVRLGLAGRKNAGRTQGDSSRGKRQNSGGG